MSDATPPHIPKLIERNRSVRQGRFAYEDREWLRSRYEAGLSFAEIAAEAECSLRTVARWFHQHGLEPRPVGYKRPHKRRERKIPRCACGQAMSYSRKQCWDCRNKSFRGSNHYNWSGIADVMLLLRRHVAHHWRPVIFERDSYHCQQCGDDRGGNLHAHHIIPLSVLVRSKREAWEPNTSTVEGRVAFSDRLRSDADIMDLANGVTLCEDCHRATHRGQGTFAYAAVNGKEEAECQRAGRGRWLASWMSMMVIRSN